MDRLMLEMPLDMYDWALGDGGNHGFELTTAVRVLIDG